MGQGQYLGRTVRVRACEQLKTVAIIQARMTSSRLPGKILADLAGRPMLAQQIARLRRCHRLDDLVIATTTNATDDPVVELARREDAGWFRGDEHDVLSRYLGAARQFHADVVVRITADCPLIDAETTDQVIDALRASPADYASNIEPRTFPRGLDTEAMYVDVLERLGRLAVDRSAREHVTILVNRDRRDLFVRRSVTHPVDHSDLRWTVDVPDDLELVRRIYDVAHLADRSVSFPELVSIVRSHPNLLTINSHVEQARS